MYELALVEWHVTPEYINEHWTEEILQLLFVSRRKRFNAQPKPEYTGSVHHRMSNEQFFSKNGFSVETR